MPDEVPPGFSERDQRLRERNLATFRAFSEMDPSDKSKRLHFHFRSMPLEILGGDRVEGLRLQRTVVEDGEAIGTGRYYDVLCGTIIAAVGYRMGPLEGVPLDGRRGNVVNDGGRVDDGFFVVGWAKRGATGVISSNKPDGDQVAEIIANEIAPGNKPGRPTFEDHLTSRGIRWVSFEDWRYIDEAEIAAAAEGMPRKKFVSVDEMITFLDDEKSRDDS